jgi:hypothetical protein
MSFLKLSWCQLIKIILSQLGGNPLQQIYSQLQQGLPTMAPASGLIPSALQDIKNFVEQATAAVQAAQQAANDFTDIVDNISNQLLQNPVGAVTTATIAAANARITEIDTLLSTETNSITITELTEERAALVQTITLLTTFKTNTDRLSGVSTSTGGRGSQSCSLQDLLGSGCKPNEDVPDIDLQNLIESLKQGDAIEALKTKLLNASGVSDLKIAIETFNTTISGFNASFTATLDRAAIRNAVSAQVSQIVFNLLTGCGNQVYDLTLKPDVKAKLQPWVALLEQQRDGTILTNEGEPQTYPDTEQAVSNQGNISIQVNVTE